MAKITAQEPATRVAPQRVQGAAQAVATPTPKKATGTLQNKSTRPLDPSETVSGQRLQAYQDPQETKVRAALDQLRAQFPNLTQEQWISYLSTPSQLKIERQADEAAQATVAKATPQEKAAAENVSQNFQPHHHRKYTADEVLLYKELKTQLPPSAQADLKKLLMDGKLLEMDSKGSGTLLHYLHELSQVDLSGMQKADGAKKETVLEQVLHDLADPNSIQQRMDVSCLGTAGQFDLAKSKPAEYARVVSELYQKDRLTEKNDYAAQFGFADSSTFANLIGLTKRIEDGVKDGKFSIGFIDSTVNFVEKHFPKMSAASRKFFDNFKDAVEAYNQGNLFKALNIVTENRKVNATQEVKDEIARMGNALVTDVDLVFQLNNTEGGDKLGTYAKKGLFGQQGYYVDGKGEALKTVQERVQSGERVYGVLQSGENNGHMVVIKGAQNGKITFYDPDSEKSEETIDEQDFEQQFKVVFLPEAQAGSLAHIQENDDLPIWGRGTRAGTRR